MLALKSLGGWVEGGWGRREGPDPPDLLPILSPLRPVLRCDIGGTNSFDCPLPALVAKCSAKLECVPNKYCRKLKRLKQAKKYVEKREGKQEKWEKKCSPSPP